MASTTRILACFVCVHTHIPYACSICLPLIFHSHSFSLSLSHTHTHTLSLSLSLSLSPVMEWVELGHSSVSILSWRDSRQRVWWTSSRQSSLPVSIDLACSEMLYVIIWINFSSLFYKEPFVQFPLFHISLSTQGQYAFCHEVLADFVCNYDNYANFKDIM